MRAKFYRKKKAEFAGKIFARDNNRIGIWRLLAAAKAHFQNYTSKLDLAIAVFLHSSCPATLLTRIPPGPHPFSPATLFTCIPHSFMSCNRPFPEFLSILTFTEPSWPAFLPSTISPELYPSFPSCPAIRPFPTYIYHASVLCCIHTLLQVRNC